MTVIKVAVAIGIALLIPLLANMTVQIWHEPPKYDAYYSYYEIAPKTPQEREAAEIRRRQQEEQYEKATKAFNTSAFYITFPMGLAFIVGSYFLRRKPTLGGATLFGGLSTVASASYASWESLPGGLRYGTLLFTLALLVVFALAIERKPVAKSVAAE